MLSMHSLLAAAVLAATVIAQTPDDFQPGSLVNLGVAYPRAQIEPVGTQVSGLDIVGTVPRLDIPASALTGPNGEMIPDRRFMVFMIDMDVVRDNQATTVLHWFQPDLVPAGDAIVLFGNISTPVLSAEQMDTKIPLMVDPNIAKMSRRQAPPLPAGAPMNPNNIPAGLLGAPAQSRYLGPAPPPGPPHRYVQVLFAQPRNFTFPPCFTNIVSQPNAGAGGDSTGRLGFDIQQFMRAAQLPARPLAGNYFRAQNPQPGSLNVNVQGMALRNNQCPNVAPMQPKAPGAAKRKLIRLF